MFWVYLLENPRGKFYVGQTENIAARIQDHNRTDCFDGHFTAKKRSVETRLVGGAQFPQLSRAAGTANQADEVCQMDSRTFIGCPSRGCSVNPDESGL